MQSSSRDSPKDDLEWSIDEEIKLFYALRYHKPVGKFKFVLNLVN